MPDRPPPLVLIADDEMVIRELLRRRLSVDGLQVETAEDGEQALERVARGFVNVLITDVQMPGVNGIDVLKQVKKSSPATEVIVMTAYSSIQTATDAVRLGAYDYLQKPFEHVDAVAHKVRLALRQQKLELDARALERGVCEAIAAIESRLAILRQAGGASAAAAEEIAATIAGLKAGMQRT